MADDPSSKADERLRAYAKKRRSGMGAEFQMPPATRRALQAEVARQFSREEEEPREATASFGGFWPRFAVGAVVLGFVLAGSFIGWQREQAQTKVHTPPAEQEQVRLARAEQAPPPVSVPALKQKMDAAESIASDPASLNFTLASDTQHGEAALPVETGQHFARVNAPTALRKNFNSPPAPSILSSFRVDREGDRITFTDSDGSVYLGRIVTRPTHDNTNGAVQFEAAGTNLTLKAMVTLAGTMNTTDALPQSLPDQEQESTRTQTLAVSKTLAVDKREEALTRTRPVEQAEQRGFQERRGLAQKITASSPALPQSAQIRATVIIGSQTRFELIASEPPKTN